VRLTRCCAPQRAEALNPKPTSSKVTEEKSADMAAAEAAVLFRNRTCGWFMAGGAAAARARLAR
jgi:hypothetical protein